MQRILIVFFICLTSSSFGQNKPSYIDALFYGKNGLKNKLPNIGLSIGIFQDGKTNFYSFGNTCHNHNSKQKVDSNTVYEIGSNTKLSPYWRWYAAWYSAAAYL